MKKIIIVAFLMTLSYSISATRTAFAQGSCPVNLTNYPGDQLIFQCWPADTPCVPNCIPTLPPQSCIAYKIQNLYGVSGKKITKIDISCTPPPDSDYTICSLYKYDPVASTYTNWCSRFAIDSCGVPGGSYYSMEFFACNVPGEINVGQWLYVTICHACTKCLWTIFFDDGSYCNIDPSNVPEGDGNPNKNCCN